ncbi:hypothetical protein HID58_024611 [Brassica napus]|uniref:Tetraspanin family protein n=1 Tax=Brassica napus TaxID=3708 RepID=A0ABQ8CIN6_BRANA|nr:hypothetical protein HID58_024611 [Brassica napus]
MRHNCCHLSFASTLKILNFVQAFFGVSIIIYSIWMLDQYHRHVPVDPPTSSSGLGIAKVSEPLNNPAALMVLGSSGGDHHGFNLRSLDLPAPWFIYSFMAVGVLVCIVTIIGFIAAEAINGCCLCFVSLLIHDKPHFLFSISVNRLIESLPNRRDSLFTWNGFIFVFPLTVVLKYSILKTLLILLEAALVAFIAIDRQWEKDLPYDPTGELNSLRAFIEDNIDICKWVGAAVVVVQLLSLLLAMVLRAMVSPKRPELDDEEDFENPRSRAWDPLLGSQANQASAGPSKSENWSSRIREKVNTHHFFLICFTYQIRLVVPVTDKKKWFLSQYGLNQSQAVNPKG